MKYMHNNSIMFYGFEYSGRLFFYSNPKLLLVNKRTSVGKVHFHMSKMQPVVHY